MLLHTSGILQSHDLDTIISYSVYSWILHTLKVRETKDEGCIMTKQDSYDSIESDDNIMEEFTT